MYYSEVTVDEGFTNYKLYVLRSLSDALKSVQSSASDLQKINLSNAPKSYGQFLYQIRKGPRKYLESRR